MRMSAEQEKVRSLLIDTITLLCRNGLTFASDVKVQGLLAITIDSKEFFVVQIDETLAENVDNDAIECVGGESDQMEEHDVSQTRNTPSSSSMRRRQAGAQNGQGRPPVGRKRVRRVVAEEIATDCKSFCPRPSQNDVLADDYQDVFVAGLSSVSAQVKVEDDDLLLVDSSGNSVVNQSYGYGNSIGDFRPNRKDFGNGLMVSGGSVRGGQQARSRQGRRRMGEWSSFNEGVEWTGQQGAGESLSAVNYDLDETEEKHRPQSSQQQQQNNVMDVSIDDEVYNLEAGDDYSSEASGNAMAFACQYKDCDKAFTYNHNLLRHQRQVHGCVFGAQSEVTYFCRINGCTSTFRSEAALTRHRNKAHGQPI